MPLDEGPVSRDAPALSITNLAEGDLTSPEGSGAMFFLKFDTIPTIYMASHLYSHLPKLSSRLTATYFAH
jgi:hypothetical protein